MLPYLVPALWLGNKETDVMRIDREATRGLPLYLFYMINYDVIYNV